MAVEAAVSFAVETLGNFLIEKAVFLKGVEGDVEWLRNELKRMQCFQKDAARKQSKSESIRNWISEIREVAHDAADTIEMFVLNVESRAQQQGRSDCCFQYPNRVYHLNRVGKEIESIRKRLRDIEDGRVRYGIQDDDHGRDAGTSIQMEIMEDYASGDFGKVHLADDEPLDIVGKGNVKVVTSNGSMIKLNGVRHIPGLLICPNEISMSKETAQKPI